MGIIEAAGDWGAPPLWIDAPETAVWLERLWVVRSAKQRAQRIADALHGRGDLPALFERDNGEPL